jgi:hypothetical protein
MRASASQRAQRLDRCRALLQECSSPSQAAQLLARTFSISTRQAYRYLKEAQGVNRALPTITPKVSFTVKLPITQVRQLRRYATRTQLTMSEIVSRALSAVLDRGHGRG